MTHDPVLLDEAVDALDIRGDRANGIYLDGTFGRGGHSRLILEKLGEKGRLIAFDKDPEAPIFEICDYGLVADGAETCRELTAKLGG